MGCRSPPTESDVPVMANRVIEFTGVVWFRLDDLRCWYQARWRLSDAYSYIVHFPLEDDDEAWHPYYEIERRAIAAAAFREVANENPS